jgi:serine/threonine protein kinase/WD40 repeat protein
VIRSGAVEDTKRPPGAPRDAAAPADGATVAGAPAPGAEAMPPPMPTAAAAVVSTLPPPMPTAAAAVVSTLPPPMPTAAAAVVSTLPPPMPTAPAAVISTLPPPMPTGAAPIAPSDGATVTGSLPGGLASLPPPMPGPPPVPGGPPAMPGAFFPYMPGTVQMPFGAAPAPAAAPIMATVTGPVVPDSKPPEMPSAGRYELGPEIARGGMGRVVTATDTLLGRTVALKEVLSMDPDVLRRFARETRITARLEHPSIVPLHDAGTAAGGAPYYVMRKISGRPLEQLVAAADTLGKRLVLIPHIVDAAQAIAHAHERGIVHRDIKPSNILVGELGETIVIDWGLAKAIGEADEPARLDLSGSLAAIPRIQTGAVAATVATGVHEPLDTEEIKTRAGIVFGTPGFMAPEQLRGFPVTERCDVYALGATLYHLLSRKPPHHAKTADEMMRAAVRAPPTPIAELVPGVPAELSTIVDKALAHDPDARYPDARALAADLQRFLSGQLVASHRYSRRERLVRFVRKNRVPVMITLAASLALAVGGTIAVSRVIEERDRADVHARLAEDERDSLILSQASEKVQLNPTRALAMVKPLAAKYWREVRMIATAARAHGVAYGMPAANRTLSLELSRDGARALTGGSDGAVRIYDLPKRTWRELPAGVGGEAQARFADDERRIVVWRDRTLAILDAAGGAARTVTAPTPIAGLEVVGTTAYWVDGQRTLWQLDLAAPAAAPAELPLPEPVTRVVPSPDGRYLALAGRDHLLLLDRTDRTRPAEPMEITLGTTTALDWSTDGKALGALVDESAVLVSTEDAPHIVQRNHVGARSDVVHSNDRLYVLGPTGVGTVVRENLPAPRKQVDGLPVGLREARGGTVVAGSSGRIVVLSPFGDRALPIPAGKLALVDASPRAPYIVGAIEDRLLIWNLDDMEPRRVADQRPGPGAQLLGPHHAIASFADAGTQWIDLETGKAESLGDWPLLTAAASPSGDLACAIDIDGRARLLGHGRAPAPIEGHYEVAGFASETDLLLGSGVDGTVHLYDPQSGKRTTLVHSPGKLLDLAWNRAAPAWAAALFGGGTLWRRNLATGAEATATGVSTAGHLQVLRDGTVMFADGRAVRAWRASGAVELHAELPRKVVTIGLAGPGHLLALLDDDSAWLVDLTAPGRVEQTEAVVSSREEDPRKQDPRKQDPVSLSLAADTGTLVVPQSGGINVVDTVGFFTWPLAVQPPAPNLYETAKVAYADPRISADGTRVIARLLDPAGGALVTWSLTVPQSGAETAKWVDSLTNAVLDSGRSNKLIWR